MTNNQLTDERLVKILSETQATIMEHNSRCVRGSVEVDARLFESMLMELQERRKAAMGSEPVTYIPVLYKGAELLSRSGLELIRDGASFATDLESACMAETLLAAAQPAPVVSEVSPLVSELPAPVVPDDVLDALQKVARIRLDMNDFDGDRRGIADCLGDAEEALIEVVNRRAAMLNGGKP